MPEREVILKKIENDIELTDEEYKYYLMHILNHSEHEADTIITISKNTDPNVKID